MTTVRPMLTRFEVHTILWNLAAEHAGLEPAQLTPQSRLTHELGADSLTITELTLALEDRFGVTIPEELLDNGELNLGQIEEALWKQLEAA